MSYLDKLLAGRPVTWKPLGEVGKIYSGLSGKTKEDFKEGNAQFVPYTNIFNNLSVDTDDLSVVRITDSEKQNVVKYGDILFTGSSETADEVGMSSVVTCAIERPVYLNSFCFGYRFNSDINILPTFCKHLFRGSIMRNAIIRAANGVTRHNISKVQFLKILIPIPPRDVQEEIVRVLDRFTELKAELEAELEARQKQYAYYRDLLLSFPDDAVTYLPLSDVTNYEQPTNYIVRSTEYSYSNNTPVLTAGKTFVLGYTSETDGIYRASDNPVIIFDDFTTSSKWVDFDFKVKSSAMKLITAKDESIAKLRYIYYWLNTLPSGLVQGDHKRQWISSYCNKKIPIPPLEEQERIVGILDRFDTIAHSISEGLPRELELRRKQYGYYRDHLLTFPPQD